jgi:hypothetical protein
MPDFSDGQYAHGFPKITVRNREVVEWLSNGVVE